MAKKVRTYHKIDQHNFNAVKTLINTGLSGREIQRALGISPSTFHRIKASETLEEYRQVVNQKNNPQKYFPEKTEGEKIVEQIAEAARASVEINFTEAQAEIVIEVLNKILEKVSLIADNTKPKGLFR
jgi:DNA-binding MarR family transcriptional regulator